MNHIWFLHCFHISKYFTILMGTSLCNTYAILINSYIKISCLSMDLNIQRLWSLRVYTKCLFFSYTYLGRHCSLFNLDTVLSRWLYSFESYTIIPLPNYNMPKKEASTLRMLSLVYSKSHTKHCNTTPPIKQNMMHSILCHIDLQCFHLFNHSLSLASFSSMIATDDVPSIS
jgi:hypothetical protein